MTRGQYWALCAAVVLSVAAFYRAAQAVQAVGVVPAASNAPVWG